MLFAVDMVIVVEVWIVYDIVEEVVATMEAKSVVVFWAIDEACHHRNGRLHHHYHGSGRPTYD